jgi:protein-S-isoprenylcysteine O-methyltransferase Ste14
VGHMMWIGLGFLAFVLLSVFDFNKLKPLHPIFNISFALGCLLLAYATGGVLFASARTLSFVPIPALWVLAILGLVEMFYALFFALPFNATYVEGTPRLKVVDTGLYALCRHPGVWGFFAFYLFASMASGNGDLLVAGLVWTVFDVLHVAMQDVWFFPQTLPGYDEYRKSTPFLLFGLKEIRKCIRTFKRGK